MAMATIASRHPERVGQRPTQLPDMTRADLAELFHALGYSVGVEVGVESGEYSDVLCQAMPGLQLTCIDPWTVIPMYRPHLTQADIDQLYATARRRLAADSVTFIKQPSAVAVDDIADGSQDFVYLDGLHDFAGLAADLAAWSPKIRSGGILAGHDYRRSAPKRASVPDRAMLRHVCHVVPAWTRAYGIDPWYVCGRDEDRDGEVRESSRSWFWVVE